MLSSGIRRDRMQESERIRKILGISRAEFSRRYHIPVRTLEDWDAGKATPPPYVIELLERVVKADKIVDEGDSKVKDAVKTIKEACEGFDDPDALYDEACLVFKALQEWGYILIKE
jgi:ribosome-binding protein aMBF1 (putative translation factor)